MSNLVNERKVYKTKNYKLFKKLRGNRNVDRSRVRSLMALMEANGNRTDVMPVIINQEGYVLDGQHRLEALKELNWEVGYIIENGDLGLVRVLNRGGKNWSWYDVAISYADSDNEAYKQFVELVNSYKFGFATNLRLVSKGKGNVKGKLHRAFHSGDLEVVGRSIMIERAEHLKEVLSVVTPSQTNFQLAAANTIVHPLYDHARMMRKMKQLGHTLPEVDREPSYLRHIEDIYNQSFAESSRVRFY